MPRERQGSTVEDRSPRRQDLDRVRHFIDTSCRSMDGFRVNESDWSRRRTTRGLISWLGGAWLGAQAAHRKERWGHIDELETQWLNATRQKTSKGEADARYAAVQRTRQVVEAAAKRHLRS